MKKKLAYVLSAFCNFMFRVHDGVLEFRINLGELESTRGNKKRA